RARARTVDGVSGRLVDGPRLSRCVRPARERAVHLAPAVPVVPAPVHRSAPAVSVAAPGPARAAVVLRLAWLLHPCAHLRVRSAGLPAAALSARAHAVAAASPYPPAPARRPPVRAPRT